MNADSEREKVFEEINDQFCLKKANIKELNEYLAGVVKMIELPQILADLEQELIDLLIKNNIKLNHVSSLNEAQMGRVIHAHPNVTMFNESEGRFVFASSLNVNKYLYCARAYNQGLQRVGKRSYVLPVNDNLNIEQSWLGLKRNVFNYFLKADNFRPVITIIWDKKGKPSFLFEDEWVSTKNEIWGKCEEICDITPLLDEVDLYVPTSHDIDANLGLVARIRESRTPSKSLHNAVYHKYLEDVREVIKIYKPLNKIV